MAIKLKDAVAVVKKRFASGARNMSPLQMKTGKKSPNYGRERNHGRLFLSAYGESSRSR